ncbi:unnamed protein product [Closterium sp. NIES-53]
MMTTHVLPLSIPSVPNLTLPPSSFAGLNRLAFVLGVLSHVSTLMVVANSSITLSLLTVPLMEFVRPLLFPTLLNRTVLPSIAIALSWRSLVVSSLMPLPHTLFGAMIFSMPLCFLTFALILFAPPLPRSSSGLAASSLSAIFGYGDVSPMSLSIRQTAHARVGSSLPRHSSVRSLASSLTIVATFSMSLRLSSSFAARMSSLTKLPLHFSPPPAAPPAPSLHWSDFDPSPSFTHFPPSPPPLPPPLPLLPRQPLLPPLPTLSLAPPLMPLPPRLPCPLHPRLPLLRFHPLLSPPPSRALLVLWTSALSNFNHSALFTRLSPSHDLDLLEDRFEELFSIHPVPPLLSVTIVDFSNSPTLLSVNTAAIPTPHTYSEAVSGFHATEWMAAIIVECEAFTRTHAYVDSVPPPSATIVKGKWVFCVKQLLGELPIFKARY